MYEYMKKSFLVFCLVAACSSAYTMERESFSGLRKAISPGRLSAAIIQHELDAIDVHVLTQEEKGPLDTLLGEVQDRIKASRISDLNKKTLRDTIAEIKHALHPSESQEESDSNQESNGAPELPSQEQVVPQNEQIPAQVPAAPASEILDDSQSNDRNPENVEPPIVLPTGDAGNNNNPEPKVPSRFGNLTIKNVAKFGSIFTVSVIVVAATAVTAKNVYSVDLVAHEEQALENLENCLKTQVQKTAFDTDEFYQLVASVCLLTDDEREELITNAATGERNQSIEFMQENRENILDRVRNLSYVQAAKLKAAIYLKELAAACSALFAIEEDSVDAE